MKPFPRLPVARPRSSGAPSGGDAAGGTALFLDFDGTLVDIAPAPDLVVVPDALIDALRTLRERLDDALAIVTGRPLEQIDHFLPGIPFAVGAEHGAVLRLSEGAAPTMVALPTMPEDWLPRAQAEIDRHDGALLERKKSGFVMHYRACPDAGPEFRSFLDRLVADQDGAFNVLSSKMAWELRAHGSDKGTAVETLAAVAPFAGRRPVFVGDDVTDQHGIDACTRLGGTGYMVPDVFGEPERVREWLRLLAAGDTSVWES